MVVHPMVPSVKRITQKNKSKIWVVWVEKFEVHKSHLGFQPVPRFLEIFWRKNPLKFGLVPKSSFWKNGWLVEQPVYITRQCKIHNLKMYFLLKAVIFHCHLSFRVCKELAHHPIETTIYSHLENSFGSIFVWTTFAILKIWSIIQLKPPIKWFFSRSTELSMIILNIWILKSFQSALHITQISIRSSMPQSFGLTLGARKTTTDLPFHQPQHPGGLKNKSTEISRLGHVGILCSSKLVQKWNERVGRSSFPEIKQLFGRKFFQNSSALNDAGIPLYLTSRGPSRLRPSFSEISKRDPQQSTLALNLEFQMTKPQSSKVIVKELLKIKSYQNTYAWSYLCETIIHWTSYDILRQKLTTNCIPYELNRQVLGYGSGT